MTRTVSRLLCQSPNQLDPQVYSSSRRRQLSHRKSHICIHLPMSTLNGVKVCRGYPLQESLQLLSEEGEKVDSVVSYCVSLCVALLDNWPNGRKKG